MSNVLKITELKNELNAAWAVRSTDESFSADEARVAAASAAYNAEYDKAMSLKAEYEAMPETAAGSGITNAQDTFGGHADSEKSVEFWMCARDSLQMMRDFGDTSGL